MKLIRQPRRSRDIETDRKAEEFAQALREIGVRVQVEECSADATEWLRIFTYQMRETHCSCTSPLDLISKLTISEDCDILLSSAERRQVLDLLTRLLRRNSHSDADHLRQRLSTLALHLDAKLQEVAELQADVADVLAENAQLRKENGELTQRIEYFKQAMEEIGSGELACTSKFPGIEVGSDKENEAPEHPKHRRNAPTFSSGDFQCVCHEEPKRS